MPSNTSSSAPGMARAVARPPLTFDQRIVRPVQDQSRDRHRPQRRGPVAGRRDRDELAGHADRIVGAVVGESGPPAQVGFVELESRRADHAQDRNGPFDRLRACGRW